MCEVPQVGRVLLGVHEVHYCFAVVTVRKQNVALRSCLRLCFIGTNRVELVELVGFFTCSIGNQPFSVGLVDQLFQPIRNPVELVENDGYPPLS